MPRERPALEASQRCMQYNLDLWDRCGYENMWIQDALRKNMRRLIDFMKADQLTPPQFSHFSVFVPPFALVPTDLPHIFTALQCKLPMTQEEWKTRADACEESSKVAQGSLPIPTSCRPFHSFSSTASRERTPWSQVAAHASIATSFRSDHITQL